MFRRPHIRCWLFKLLKRYSLTCDSVDVCLRVFPFAVRRSRARASPRTIHGRALQADGDLVNVPTPNSFYSTPVRLSVDEDQALLPSSPRHQARIIASPGLYDYFGVLCRYAPRAARPWHPASRASIWHTARLPIRHLASSMRWDSIVQAARSVLVTGVNAFDDAEFGNFKGSFESTTRLELRVRPLTGERQL